MHRIDQEVKTNTCMAKIVVESSSVKSLNFKLLFCVVKFDSFHSDSAYEDLNLEKDEDFVDLDDVCSLLTDIGTF